ncbi:phage/plasmid replication protein [Bacteroides sp. 51]|uniref:phage/plasmid replication domain-containing protein n=1 Tax=Bacteroides sp. 51 TaxID=2302938 RepID=UPI0013D6BB81|nr:phage/plasmid replication protein [Bacteroides sp. 51]NDV82229.1 hypothetical protein [Bacteroides sp. 51]
MYDNLDFKIRKGDTGSIDFLSETPCYFDVTGEHLFEGGTVITGNLDGYKVTVSENGVNLTDGSLCKYYLGDNFQTLGRGDTERAIEKLSDTLHLHVGKAAVSRIDIAQNFIVKQPIENYFNHLGELPYYKRCPMLNEGSLYYFNYKNIIVFYDKVKEQKAKGRPIPELYQGRYTLRYETRYKQRLPSVFGVEKVTGALLYDEAFYIDLVKRWKNAYQTIKKINDVSLNFEIMRSKQELYKMGVVSLIEQQGGQITVLEQINEAQKRGDLTRKQAYDLRQTINDACKAKVGLTVKNEAIEELDKKVKEATRFYR